MLCPIDLSGESQFSRISYMEWPSLFDRGPKINTPGCLDREAIAEVQPCLTFALVCLSAPWLL